MVKFFALLLSILSCSHQRANSGPSGWEQKTKEELLRHPYFKNLKVKQVSASNEREQLLFFDQTPFQTGASCQGLGGCLGLPSYNCQYQILLIKNKIHEFNSVGVCPPRKTTEPLKR